jgi:hypothetical protein
MIMSDKMDQLDQIPIEAALPPEMALAYEKAGYSKAGRDAVSSVDVLRRTGHGG